jgi:hypothetical protein
MTPLQQKMKIDWALEILNSIPMDCVKVVDQTHVDDIKGLLLTWRHRLQAKMDEYEIQSRS